jgi:hypoxanthine-DNA glycosylase
MAEGLEIPSSRERPPSIATDFPAAPIPPSPRWQGEGRGEGQPEKRSFPPLVDARSGVLVLGTLPGEESLRRAQYYAHPRNLFWPIVFALFGMTPPADYRERLGFAAAHGIGLWDVVAVGRRIASADATIRLEKPNPVCDLLDCHPRIRAVAFNGSGAERLHDRHFARRPALAYLSLPSTSPAHARLDLAAKLARWQALRPFLDPA